MAQRASPLERAVDEFTGGDRVSGHRQCALHAPLRRLPEIEATVVIGMSYHHDRAVTQAGRARNRRLDQQRTAAAVGLRGYARHRRQCQYLFAASSGPIELDRKQENVAGNPVAHLGHRRKIGHETRCSADGHHQLRLFLTSEGATIDHADGVGITLLFWSYPDFLHGLVLRMYALPYSTTTHARSQVQLSCFPRHIRYFELMRKPQLLAVSS